MTPLPPTVSQAEFDYALRGARVLALKYVQTRRIPIEIEDLEGAARYGVARALHNYDPARGTPFEIFAYPYAWGAIREEVRRWDPRGRKRQDEVIRGADKSEQDLPPEPFHLLTIDFVSDVDVFLEVALRLERQRAFALLSRLTRAQRTTIARYFWGGLSGSEIAEQDGVHYSAVYQRINNGLARLRTMLEGWDG